MPTNGMQRSASLLEIRLPHPQPRRRNLLVQVDAVSTNPVGSPSSQHGQGGLRYRSQPRPQSGVSMSVNVCWTIEANKSPDRSGHLSEPSSADTSKVLGKDSKHWGFVERGKALILKTTIWGGCCSKCSRLFRRMIENVQGVPRARTIVGGETESHIKTPFSRARQWHGTQ